MSYLLSVAQWGPSAYYAYSGIYSTQLFPRTLQNIVKKQGDHERDISKVCRLEPESVRGVKFVYCQDKVIAAGVGGSLSPYSCVLANEALSPLEGDPALNFIYMHEISHLKWSDIALRMGVAFAVSSLAAAFLPQIGAYLALWKVPSFLAYVIPQQLGMTAHYVSTMLTETRADMSAMAMARPEELVAVVKLFKAQIEIMQELHSRYPTLIKPDGSCTLHAKTLMGGDGQHLSDHQRLARIVARIKSAGIDEQYYTSSRTVEDYKRALRPIITSLFNS